METDEGRGGGGGKRWKNVLSVETDSGEKDEEREREEIEKYESRWDVMERKDEAWMKFIVLHLVSVFDWIYTSISLIKALHWNLLQHLVFIR